MVSNIVVLQWYKVGNDLGDPNLQNEGRHLPCVQNWQVTRIKEYRTIYMKKVYPDGRKANCLFSKENIEHM